MKELYGRRVILMHERANFFRITQSDHQTLKQFANSLREAAGHCILETFNTEAALVLQFINGMKNEEIKLRLLAKENINLDEALSFLEMYEEIHGCNSRSTMKECYAVQETRGIKPRGVSSVCYCCGEAGHFARKCKFHGSKCFKCGKQGDLAKVCKHPQKLGKSEKQRPQNSWKDHKLYADGVYAVKERARNFEVTVKINGKSTRMELDTGTAVTIFHGARGEPKRGDDGDGRRQHRYEKAIVRVAKNGATNVMGQDWINAFRAAETLRSLLANKKEVNAVESRTQNDVCAEFPVVFEDGFRHCTKISLSCPHRHGKKLNGKIPICADFSTGLNDGLMVESYPTLRPEDLYQALRGGKTFTKLDLSEAYLQVELDEESKRIPVINTHKGLYHYNRLPFSVASAPAIFQKVMNTMLAGIPNVAAYLDDIILTGATDDEHQRTLKLVLGRLKEFGLRIRKEKCIFFQKKSSIWVTFSVRRVSEQTQRRRQLLLICRCPRTLRNCGLSSEFTQERRALEVDRRAHKSGGKRKRLLNSPLLLTHYHPEWLIVLAADASNEGIGAVVYHRLSDGTVKVIAHASKKLNAAERNYGQIEKEVLALVYGVKKLHKYLWGRRFTLLTDHKPLVSIFGSKKGVPQMAACRLTRGIDNLEEQMRKMENTSGNRADRQFKIGETVMVHDYTRDRKLWREGVIVGQQGQIADGQEEKDNEMGLLLDEALPTGNSPNPAGENAQDIEAPNIFQDQISTPHKGSADSPKATVHTESSSTTVETGDREHKPDGSVTMKQDEVLQKPRRSNRVRKPPNRLSI
ncbi:putative zinc knuckle [Trichinella nativa]|uniref:Putative zinc knuckle n=1 Tax=Trichinella nativa TaxID=6335 RepID=A0A1Y3EL04_9BILA|nr:putative zinc knuckle [Trichinella nativa]